VANLRAAGKSAKSGRIHQAMATLSAPQLSLVRPSSCTVHAALRRPPRGWLVKAYGAGIEGALDFQRSIDPDRPTA
jgi:hypothetical protein